MWEREDPHAYAKRRASETGCRYAVWEQTETGLAWVAVFDRPNDRGYRECGADRRTIYRDCRLQSTCRLESTPDNAPRQ
jgi:hypothetical protein